MTIINTNVTDKRALYNLTSQSVRKAKIDELPKGADIKIDAYALFEDMDSAGEIKKVFACDVSGKLHASASPTLIRSVEEILTVFGGIDEVVLHEDKSKSGRRFIYFAF